MIPKRRKRTKLGCNSPSQIRNAGHLRWIRGFECLVNKFGTVCDERIEAAHIRTGTDGGTGMKPSDCWTIPLCSFHHRLQHQLGEESFAKHHGIDMKKIATELWAKSPHRHKSES